MEATGRSRERYYIYKCTTSKYGHNLKFQFHCDIYYMNKDYFLSRGIFIVQGLYEVVISFPIELYIILGSSFFTPTRAILGILMGQAALNHNSLLFSK